VIPSVSLAGRLFLAERGCGLSFSCDSVGVFFCPAGSELFFFLSLRNGLVVPSGCAAARRLLAPARCAPRLPRPRPSSASPAGAPRCLHETAPPTPHPGPHAGSPRSREAWPLAPTWRFETPRPGTARWRAGGGLSIRRCRGWQISPEPAGPGRASRVGETASRLLANAEGPQRGSRPAPGGIAGGGVCGRSGWGDARPHPATHGAGTTKLSRSGKKGACGAPAWRIEYPHPPYVLFRSRWRHGTGKASECSSAAGGGAR
jgi:hypothetical protein